MCNDDADRKVKVIRHAISLRNVFGWTKRDKHLLMKVKVQAANNEGLEPKYKITRSLCPCLASCSCMIVLKFETQHGSAPTDIWSELTWHAKQGSTRKYTNKVYDTA
jgi:hypothetical protein